MSLQILLLLVHPCVSVFSQEQHSDETRSVEQSPFRATVETWWRLPCKGTSGVCKLLILR